MTPSTAHRLFCGTARALDALAEASVHLVVTSPPYPMIEMWDAIFADQDTGCHERLEAGDGPGAFEAMHGVLDRAWAEVRRVLGPGGIACVNIGDATRTIDGVFRLYPNHARILEAFRGLGFDTLPAILWRKQTNAPNKFMGSGMLPAGAYVTLEHEYVLVLRKPGRRDFKKPDANAMRRRSAFFWEERNAWFSDVWFDLKGARQDLAANGFEDVRRRSGAFPFELAYRLVQMFSAQEDVVLDPFAGTGTTLLAAAASRRNSVGVEIDPAFAPVADAGFREALEPLANRRIRDRLQSHLDFVAERRKAKGADAFKHHNAVYDFPVVTRQEKELALDYVTAVRTVEAGRWEVEYAETPGLVEPGVLFGAV